MDGSEAATGGVAFAFAVLGVVSLAAVRLYKSVKNDSAEPEVAAAPEPEPARERAVTEVELAQATGEEGRELYVAVKDPYSPKITVFDVSAGKDFYGPGGPYHVFAGKNATHGLAKSSVDPSSVTGDISNLTESEKDTYMQWHAKYSSKYPIVGYLVSSGESAEDGTASAVATESKKDI